MTHQAALIHDGRGGIWPRYLLPGTHAVNAAPWAHALATRGLVGTCRKCGSYLRPGQPYKPAGSNREWYPAACMSCPWEMAAAGPRPRPRRKR